MSRARLSLKTKMSTEVHSLYDTILILDFGSQYSHLITRRIREHNIYCELLPCTTDLNALPFKPKGIILSGSPYSVYDKDAPKISERVFEMGVPVLGICYGLQLIAATFGGSVEGHDQREYGPAELLVARHDDAELSLDLLLHGVDEKTMVLMSHGDQLSTLPPHFKVIGNTATAPFAAIAHESRPIYGLQFHPETTHSVQGSLILRNFVKNICGCEASWTMASFIDAEIKKIRNLVGDKGQVIGAVSGGVDSTVAAKLMHAAIGDRFHAILVDNGLMRLNECVQVKETLTKHLGINLTVVDASAEFLGKLKDITDPEKKRKIIGNTFIEVFEREAHRIDRETAESGHGHIEWLLQGTLYPDVIESISFKGPSATIKTHHNVGGLLEDMRLKLIEPLRELFKDEVRALGKVMAIPDDLLWRHPFPGPGLGIRILGAVSASQLDILRQADDIYISELRKHNLYRSIAQAYAALLPIRSVGVMGDKRTYEQVIALRAVETTDFMTAEWFDIPTSVLRLISRRIINEVKGVNRVVYDVSSKPPSTIEWE